MKKKFEIEISEKEEICENVKLADGRIASYAILSKRPANFMLGNLIYFPTTLEELKELVNDLNINLGTIDVSAITSMRLLFKDSQRTNFDGIEDWDVSNVEDMLEIFYGCRNFNHDISKWNTSNVKIITGAFSFTNFCQDISGWDLSNVEKISSTDPFAHNHAMKQKFKPKPFDRLIFSPDLEKESKG